MRLALAALVVAMTACQTLGDVPAVLVSPGVNVQQSVGNALRQATGKDVVVATDALTTSSTLFITVSPRRSLDTTRQIGRIMTQPLRFDLVQSGRTCVLVDARNERRFILDNVECKPASDAD